MALQHFRELHVFGFGNGVKAVISKVWDADKGLYLAVYHQIKLKVDEYSEQSYTDLRRVIRSIHRIRNNLFHGGKHGIGSEGEHLRNIYLLTNGCTILDQLASLNPSIEYDYPGSY